MSKIRILHCCGTMNVGGAETMVMNWFRNIDRNKFEFDFLVFTQDKGIFDAEIEELGGKIYYAPSLGKVGIIRYIFNLIKVFKRIPPIDIVHSHMDWQGGFIVFAAYLTGIKKRIVHSHAMQEMFQSNMLHRGVIRVSKILIHLFATERLCCSEVAGKSLFGKSNMLVIKNAIDLDKFPEVDVEIREKVRKEYHIGKHEFVLGCVGNLSDNKNQTYLLELLKGLDSNIKLVLVGQGSMEQTLRKRVEELNIQDRVIFAGLQRNISRIASIFDVFLFPSKREGLGIVVIEMQALGVPCIISEGVPEEVDMELGLVEQIPLKNREQWIDKILESLRKEKEIKNIEIRKQQIQKYGYDIKENVKDLTSIYCKS